MDRKKFVEWLGEGRAICPLPGVKRRVLFLDNCSGHALTEEAKEALRKVNTEVRFLPKNATDLCQPADSFGIQEVKTA